MAEEALKDVYTCMVAGGSPSAHGTGLQSPSEVLIRLTPRARVKVRVQVILMAMGKGRVKVRVRVRVRDRVRVRGRVRAWLRMYQIGVWFKSPWRRLIGM